MITSTTKESKGTKAMKEYNSHQNHRDHPYHRHLLHQHHLHQVAGGHTDIRMGSYCVPAVSLKLRMVYSGWAAGQPFLSWW
ncbi:hypothetical protein GBAR_LOCUS12200 [Geodia barretti]|uniref:Uncharacterized protein n=1 Tax=Geodia barretti TaxID=519541 RepID=A0AA35RZ75_GEOBA|nr:hypothetical protein GBAR_LOCUS12200 [Geodia barretti]